MYKYMEKWSVIWPYTDTFSLKHLVIEPTNKLFTAVV